MTQASVVPAPAPALSFLRSLPLDAQPPARVRAEVMSAVDALWPLARPLAVDLVPGVRSREDPFVRAGAVPSVANWHLRVAQPPAGIGPLEPRYGEHPRVEQVERLDRTALDHWIAACLAATAPVDAADLVTLAVLTWVASLARVEDEDDRLTLSTGAGHVEMPVTRDAEGAWVGGPCGDDVPEPIGVEFASEQGVLLLRLTVEWSLWLDEKRPEHALLAAAQAALAQRGWGLLPKA